MPSGGLVVCDLGHLRIGAGGPVAGLVSVEPPAGLLAEPASLAETVRHVRRGRRPALGLGLPGQPDAHRAADVETREVGHREGSHAEPEVAERPIDLLR